MPALAYVTIDTPDRRLDVALPAEAPLAELLPMLIQHGGADLAQRGLAQGGWLLRRADGVALAAAETLDDQGVRDGEVLSLVRADRAWPKISYDDVAVAIAESPDRGTRWNPNTSRRAAGVAGTLASSVGCVAALRSGPGLMTGALLTLLALGAIASAWLLARVARDAVGAASVAITGLPIAFTAGFLPASSPPAGLAGAGAAGLFYVLLVAAANGGMPMPSIAGAVIATSAVLGAVAWALTSMAGAAGVTLGVAALGGAVAPAIGVRLGGLPGQRAVVAPDLASTQSPDGNGLADALIRTDMVITGLLTGLAAVAVGAGAALAGFASWPGLAMGCVCALAFGLRSRSRVLVAHRVAGLVAAAGAVVPVAATTAWQAGGGAAASIVLGGGGVAAALATAIGVSKASGSPYLARAGDALETIAVALIVPLACVSAGLFRPFIG